MRTFSGLLILEDLFDFLPTSSSNLINFFYDISNPPILIKEHDCGTTVGKYIDIDFTIEARIELATGLAIDQDRIFELLMAGTYNVAVRDTQSCTSEGGVCQLCYQSTFIDKAIPTVGTVIRIPPEYNYQTDVIISDGITTDYTLTEDAANYEKVIYILDGVKQPLGYTITGTALTLNPVPASNTYMVFRFYKTTSQPFMGYLASSYSGALLGMNALETQGINVRPSLIQSQITEAKLAVAQAEVQTLFPVIASNYIRYLDTIKDPLERALYITTLYGIYGNVTI